MLFRLHRKKEIVSLVIKSDIEEGDMIFKTSENKMTNQAVIVGIIKPEFFYINEFMMMSIPDRQESCQPDYQTKNE